MSEELQPEVRSAGEDVAGVPDTLRGRTSLAQALVLEYGLQGHVHARHHEAEAGSRADGEERDDARVAQPVLTAPSTRHSNTENVSCLCLRFQKSSEIQMRVIPQDIGTSKAIK